MDKILQKNGLIILKSNPQYKDNLYYLELKINYTFRLLKGDDKNIYYDSYGTYTLDDNNNMIILTFTEIEEDFHNIKKINIQQFLSYKIIYEEKNHVNSKSLTTIIFDKCPSPIQQKNIIDNENIFYCNFV
jgi:hypothetical protein